MSNYSYGLEGKLSLYLMLAFIKRVEMYPTVAKLIS